MLPVGLLLTLLVLTTLESSDATFANRSFTVDKSTQMFMKDGEPFRYVSGGMHYFRVPHEYWRDRLRKLRAMGANAVETYIEWSLHEPEPGVYNFQGDADVLRYIKLAQERDLLVIVRVGPYICAERNMGGFPYWLQSQGQMKVRTSDPVYMAQARKWMTKILTMLKPLLYVNGGPIIMLQVENEYGLYACDALYMQQLTQLFDEVLGKDQVVYFTTDPAHDQSLKCGHTEKALATVDFGHGADAATCFNFQRKYDASTPYVNSEFYTGWLDHWSQKHEQVSSAEIAKKLNMTLAFAPNVNVNLYMFHGGTSFGFTNGANSGDYLPNPTSYDYDAPCNEAGDLTDKYFAMREVIVSYLGDPQVKIPTRVQHKLVIPSLKMNRVNGSLFDVLGDEPPASPRPMTFEQLKQPNGYVVYSHQVSLAVTEENPSELSAPGLHDRAIVYRNGVKVGVLSRMVKKFSMKLPVKTGDKLVFVVEDMGRVNFGREITEYKGLGDRVTLNGKDLTQWTHRKVPLDSPKFLEAISSLPTVLPNSGLDTNVTALYKAQFTLENNPKDTFIHLPGWKKGVVLVNGFNLGRYWPSIGPQQSLYLPGCKLVKLPRVNEIVILELESAPCSSEATCIVKFLDNHVVNGAFRSDDA